MRFFLTDIAARPRDAICSGYSVFFVFKDFAGGYASKKRIGYFARVVVACWSMRPEPEEEVVEEGTFGGTKEKTVEEDTGDQGGGQN